jgi:hypothetical protein
MEGEHAKTRIPAAVFCLAEHLCDEMLARGWKTQDVAMRMGGTVDDMARNLLALDLIMCVHKDKLLIGDRLFAGLARAFDVPEELFRNLDKAWRDAPAETRQPFDPPESIFGPISRRALIHAVPKEEG